jgi:pSer/pThr/pTyr-binding forkhead associated (FHA) protein
VPEGSAVLRYSRGLPHSRQLGERLRFLVLSGGDKGTCFSALGNLIFIGREGCQIVLHDSNISRKHAELLWKESHYVIRDLGSSNGVVVNGHKMPEAKLAAGDIVLIGLTVLKVYLPGQRLHSVKQATSALPSSANPATASPIARKRMITMLALSFLGALAYLSGGQDTMHISPTRDFIDLETPEGRSREKNSDETPTIKSTSNYIERLRLNLGRAEARKAELEEQQRIRLAYLSRGHFAESSSVTEANRQQRADSDVFFHTGVREAQNKNYRRAIIAYNTAIIVDPSHDLAKMYLATAQASMLVELRSMEVAGFRAKGVMRLKEARMNFQNIVRYLETDNEGAAFLTPRTKHDLDELLREAKQELVDLDSLERKGA